MSAVIAIVQSKPATEIRRRLKGTGGDPSDCETDASTTPKAAPAQTVPAIPQQAARGVGWRSEIAAGERW